MAQLVHGHRYQAGVDAPVYATAGAIKSQIESAGFTNVSVTSGGTGGANYTVLATWNGADGDQPQPAEVLWFKDLTPAAAAPASPAAPAAPADDEDEDDPSPSPSAPAAPAYGQAQAGGSTIPILRAVAIGGVVFLAVTLLLRKRR